MLSLGSLAFASPWLLLALGALPVLWWLLRVTPPAPRIVHFPAIRLLFRLRQEEETPAHTPLWLLILRMALLTLLILGLAHPLLNPRAAFPGSGPLLLVVDNDWAAARHWDARVETMTALIDQAERDNRLVMVLPTAPPATGEAVRASNLMRATDARTMVQAMTPEPWPADRAAALEAVEAATTEGSTNAVWLSNGLGDKTGNAAILLAEGLQRLGNVRIFRDAAATLPRLLLPPTVEAAGLAVEVQRAQGDGEDMAAVAAADGEGNVIGRTSLTLADGEKSAHKLLALPSELRNRVERLYIQGESTAGATVLIDERWRRRPVGIVSGSPLEKEQPLLSDHYYLERALGPISEVRLGSLKDLLGGRLAMLVLADSAPSTGDELQAVERWLDAGGLVVRFAGPRLAAEADELVPVKLRRGDRTFGGAMSWTKPAKLAAFDTDSPFAGLAVPNDVQVTRQVLAEPAADLAAKTWARLEDGTPLVTAEQRGQGWLVLVHTTANTDWSNLALSGLFVDMLQRLLQMGRGVVGQGGDQMLPPLQALDGYGHLVAAPATAGGVREGSFAEIVPGPRQPPGFYGNDAIRRALNLSPGVSPPTPIAALPPGVIEETYDVPGELDLRPWLLAAMLLLLLVDIVIGLEIRGLLALKFGRAVAAVLLGVLVLMPQARAQDRPGNSDAYAVSVTTTTRLAYVVTGDATVDSVSRAGLVGLSDILAQRTAIEPGPPVDVDIETDELAFFPLLYWPVTEDQRRISPDAVEKLAEFLQRGGMILFDTRDRELGGGGTRPLRELVHGLNIPALEPVPPDHILTKAFYLMQRFPGRWAGGEVWVERHEGSVNDGVSSVVIGGNDWASAWAVDEGGRPMFAAVPGGEEQREQAFRFGVNLVMYALTGNYKADQVHVPTILRRLGQ